MGSTNVVSAEELFGPDDEHDDVLRYDDDLPNRPGYEDDGSDDGGGGRDDEAQEVENLEKLISTLTVDLKHPMKTPNSTQQLDIMYHYIEERSPQEAHGGETQSQSQAANEVKKKRIIRNPQPKLDPTRIIGPRGVGTLEEVFKDFKPKGKGREFDDLDYVLKRMEHWAHRLYPKLPFDDVMDRIAFLGKKQAIRNFLKKNRTGTDN